MNKKQTLWALIAIVVIVGGLVLYRQWRMDNLVAEIDINLENGLLKEPVIIDGETYLVPADYIFDSGADLPALNDPDYTSVTVADNYLSDEVDGISVNIDGEQYFYSYQIMNWHEVVNQTVGDAVFTITHCTLCRASQVYVNGMSDTFASAGKVYNNNQLIMDVATGSYWNQMTGMAIVGDRAGEQLERYDTVVMTWGEWKDLYPSGSVLSTETGYDRDYTRHPFENYDQANIYYFPLNQIDDRLSAKWIVDGFATDETAIAFAREIMKGTWVLNFEADDRSLVAMYDTQNDRTRVFDADDYIFTYDQDVKLFVDQDGSTWSAGGVALSGASRGKTLEQLETQSSFYMCWYANHTDTAVALIDLMDVGDKETTDDTEGSDQ